MLHNIKRQATADTTADFGYQTVFFRTEADAIVLQLFYLVADVSRVYSRLINFEYTFCQVHQLFLVVCSFAIEGGEIGWVRWVILFSIVEHSLQQSDGVSHVDDDFVQGNDIGHQMDESVLFGKRCEVDFLLLIADVRANQLEGLQRVGDVDVKSAVLIADGSPRTSLHVDCTIRNRISGFGIQQGSCDVAELWLFRRSDEDVILVEGEVQTLVACYFVYGFGDGS